MPGLGLQRAHPQPCARAHHPGADGPAVLQTLPASTRQRPGHTRLPRTPTEAPPGARSLHLPRLLARSRAAT
jgi:hypothetical protein